MQHSTHRKCSHLRFAGFIFPLFDPDICNGKPIIRGKRIAVQTILEFLSSGDTRAEVLEELINSYKLVRIFSDRIECVG